MSERILKLNYDSPSEIRSLLEMMGLGPRKRWGQNFLINPGARQRIVDLLDLKKDMITWEIGPGLGAITSLLAERTEHLTLFEIDPGYCEYLGMAYDKQGLKIVEGDIIKKWKEQILEEEPDRIVGNLPYNAASAIISDFIENDRVPAKMVFTIQNEMGDRMKAKPGTKNYSSFSILCQYGCKIIDRGILSAGSFYPAPRVSSKVIELTPNETREELLDKNIFFMLVRDMFISRRKTIRNNINSACAARFQKYSREQMYQVFLDEGISLDSRPERIEVEQFISLANRLSKTE